MPAAGGSALVSEAQSFDREKSHMDVHNCGETRATQMQRSVLLHQHAEPLNQVMAANENQTFANCRWMTLGLEDAGPHASNMDPKDIVSDANLANKLG